MESNPTCVTPSTDTAFSYSEQIEIYFFPVPYVTCVHPHRRYQLYDNGLRNQQTTINYAAERFPHNFVCAQKNYCNLSGKCPVFWLRGLCRSSAIARFVHIFVNGSGFFSVCVCVPSVCRKFFRQILRSGCGLGSLMFVCTMLQSQRQNKC